MKGTTTTVSLFSAIDGQPSVEHARFSLSSKHDDKVEDSIGDAVKEFRKRRDGWRKQNIDPDAPKGDVLMGADIFTDEAPGELFTFVARGVTNPQLLVDAYAENAVAMQAKAEKWLGAKPSKK